MRRVSAASFLSTFLVAGCCLALGVLTAPAQGQQEGEPPPMTVADWRLNLFVTAGGTPDNSTTVGTDTTATNGYNDTWDFYNPPPIEQVFVDAYLPHSDTEPGWFDLGGNFATDVRAPLEVQDTQAWRIQINNNPGGDASPQLIQVSWPEINRVPAEITLLLRDPDDLNGDDKTEYDMRIQNSFNFTGSTDGLPHLYNFAIVAGRASNPRLPGDINNDAKVNIQDATRALQAAVGSIILSNDEISAGDVVPDNKVDIKDVTKILRIAIGAD